MILSPTLPGSFSSSLLEISSSHGLPSRNKRRESTWLSRAKSEQSFSISLEYNKRSYTLHVPFPSQARTSIFHSDGMVLGRHPSFTPPVARAVVYAPYLSLSRSRNRVCWPRPTCNIWPLARLQRRASNQQASIRESQLSRELTPIMLWGELASSRCDWPAHVFCQQC